ncbi:MAG: hypothetical protein ACYSTL_02395, partial [Planctomycetota bacterium]
MEHDRGGQTQPVCEYSPSDKKRLLGIRRADWLCVGLLLVITLAFFWKGFIDPEGMIREDAASQYQPYYTFVADEITSGRFPHWNPYISCGVPFHAALQGAVLYPLRLPLNWVSYTLGYVLTIWVHFFLTGLFTYLFIRVTLKCGPLAALFGAVSFAFGGFTLGHITHPNWIQAFPWLILSVFLLSQGIERSGWIWAVAAGIPVSLMALACGVHLLLVLWVGLGIWGLGETIVRIIRKLRGDPHSPLWVCFPLVMIAVALLLGTALSAAQLWPAYYQTIRSLRTESSWEFITEFSSHPLRAPLRLVVPFYYGNYRLGYWGENNFHGHCFYAGIAPLFAAILAFPLCWKNKWVPRLGVFILVVAAIAAGRFLPVYRLFYEYFPMFDKMRNPSRFFGLVQFAIACLGAIGFQGVLQAGTNLLPKRANLTAIVVGVVLLATISGSLVQLHRLANDPTPAAEFIRSLPNLDDNLKEKRIENVTTMTRKVMFDLDVITWCGIAAAFLSVVFLWAFFAFRTHRAIVGWILVPMLLLDLGMFSGGMWHYVKTGQTHVSIVITDTPEHVRYLQENIDHQRYVCWGWRRTHLDRFRGMQFRVRHTIINRGGTFHTPRQWTTILQAWNRNRRIGNLLGVRYAVDNKLIRSRGVRLVYKK